ncbi:MGMT family protein [Actinotalea ferrariae]|uniref:MGMT family protein n=1 Tax=Actinotalea ferrariae TaxID=1386098 RepID=UPI001C8B54E8|nr:MGMT family protein [Actinotalea ferrariae]MBX9245878.1 MGMT family protein [Actinotalea ferrariae]
MDDDYLEAVLDLVEQVPPGRVVTYGSVAEVLADRLGRGGPRQVGQVMSRAGGDLPWWRVVNASGRPPAHLHGEAIRRLRAEGCPVLGEGDDAHVAVRRALWWPDDDVPG